MNDSLLNYEQKFFIDGLEISGLQGVAGGYYITEQPINVLGFGNVGKGFFAGGVEDAPQEMAALTSPLEGRFSLDNILVSRDIFMDYSGGASFSGSLNFPGGSFGFTSGYISNHQVDCRVGQIPRTTTSIYSFGNVGSGISAEFSDKTFTDAPKIEITSQEKIKIRCPGTGTNRVVSATYSLATQLDPIYIVGSSEAVQVDVVWPMEAEMRFHLEVDRFEYKAMRDYFVKPTLNTVSMSLHDCEDNLIQEYKIVSGRLVEESIRSSVDEVLSVDLSYKTYYNKR